MANIDFETARIVAENALRKSGYGGIVNANGVELDFERSWKAHVTQGDETFEIPVNFQNLRDGLAKAIVDMLTATQVSGSISSGDTSTSNQTVTSSSKVNINNTNPNSTKKAARAGDATLIDITTDATFVAWIAAVSTTLNTLSPGSVPIVPTSVTGKINSGSNTVNIGD